MKVSNETLSVLKNFCEINEGIFITKGSVIETVSKKKNVLAKATVPDNFPEDFGIGDLSNFLSHILLDKEHPAELVFKNGDDFTIKFEDDSETTWRKTTKNTIVTPPDKKITVKPDYTLVMTKGVFSWINRVAVNLGLPNIAFLSDGKDVYIKAFDAKNDSAHTNKTKLKDVTSKEEFNMIFEIENLKFLEGDYTVTVSKSGVAHFKNKNFPVEYWVTVSISTFA